MLHLVSVHGQLFLFRSTKFRRSYIFVHSILRCYLPSGFVFVVSFVQYMVNSYKCFEGLRLMMGSSLKWRDFWL